MQAAHLESICFSPWEGCRESLTQLFRKVSSSELCICRSLAILDGTRSTRRTVVLPLELVGPRPLVFCPQNCRSRLIGSDQKLATRGVDRSRTECLVAHTVFRKKSSAAGKESYHVAMLPVRAGHRCIWFSIWEPSGIRVLFFARAELKLDRAKSCQGAHNFASEFLS